MKGFPKSALILGVSGKAAKVSYEQKFCKFLATSAQVSIIFL